MGGRREKKRKEEQQKERNDGEGNSQKELGKRRVAFIHISLSPFFIPPSLPSDASAMTPLAHLSEQRYF